MNIRQYRRTFNICFRSILFLSLLTGFLVTTTPVQAAAMSVDLAIETFSGGPAVVVDPEPSMVGESYLISFTVRPETSGTTPYGTVVVSDGLGNSCSRTVTSGSYPSGWGWYCSITSSNGGTLTLTAAFTPADPSVFLPATDTHSHTVNGTHIEIETFSGGPTGTDDPDPSMVGQSYTVSFTVRPSGVGSISPYGTFTVTDGEGHSCSRTVTSGSYTSGWGWYCNITSTSVGIKTLTGTFVPTDSATFGGTAITTEEHTVTQASTTTTLSSSVSFSYVGDPVTFTSTTSPSPDGGTVRFTDNGTTITGCNTQSINTSGVATCTTSALAYGSHMIRAAYSGNSNYSGSIGILSGFQVYDITPPGVTITSSLTSPTNVSPIPITITFTEAVTGFDLADISVANGSANNFSGSGTTYTASVTPAANGQVTVNVYAGVASDSAGNINTAAPSFVFTYDTISPTISITPASSSPTNDSPITFNITFSEDVVNFTIGDISVTNGTKGNFSGSGSTYSVNVTPGSDGAVTFNIGAGVANDATGNGNTASATISITYDGTAPTVSITSSVGSSTNVAPIPVTFTFSELVTGFTSTDIAVTNGASSDFSGSGLTYTANITPAAEGTVTVNVGAGVAIDHVGNGNTSGSLSVVYDTTAPNLVSITRSSPLSSPTNADSLTFQVAFSEAVQNVNSPDFTVVGATTAVISSYTQIDQQTYTVTVSGGDLAGYNGTVGIGLSAGQDITDLAGNSLTTGTPVTNEIYILDNTAPAVTIDSISPNPSNTDTTITWHADDSGSLIVHSGGTDCSTGTLLLSDTYSASGTMNVTSPISMFDEGANTIRVCITDAVGNTGIATATLTRDTLAPVITINDPGTDPDTSKTISAVIPDGTLTMSNTTGSICDATLTFIAYSIQTFSSEADNGIRVCYRAEDAVGNISFSLSDPIAGIDRTAPEIVITAPDSSPAQSKTITAATSDGTLFMSNTPGTVCNATLTFIPYAAQTFTSESDNGLHVCYRSEDAVGNIAYLLSDAIAGIDNTSIGIIAGSGVVGNPGSQWIVNFGVNPSRFRTIQVRFDSEAYNPDDPSDPALFDPDDVTNPHNYLLLQTGPNLAYDTAGCQAFATNGDLPVGDDVLIPFDPGIYSSSDTPTVTLALSSGNPLPNGVYRLYICGTTSIVDLAGNPLNNGAYDTVINFTVTDPEPEEIPTTGFAPDQEVVLSEQTVTYTQSNLWIEIPDLDVQMDIIGVPLSSNGTWDVSWLGENAGWLEGSAFPTWNGNSVITGHVWNADNTPGPFRYLDTLIYGDRIIIHEGNTEYVYEVRSISQVLPSGTSQMLRHEDSPWLTLVTCSGYNEDTGAYRYRILVRAVLVDVH
jgi:LPXTG-site transpeptidase (sortase) family protein